jgi:hypothetical protein
MSYAQWRNSYTPPTPLRYRYRFNVVLGFYLGLSSRVRTVFLYSLSLVSLLSGRFTTSALV